MGADGEICSLQSCGSANAAKVCAQLSVAFLRNKRARFTKNYFTHRRSFQKRINQKHPHLSPLPTSGARRGSILPLILELLKRHELDGLKPFKFQGGPCTTILLRKLSPARLVLLRENKCDTARHPVWPASNPSTL